MEPVQIEIKVTGQTKWFPEVQEILTVLFQKPVQVAWVQEVPGEVPRQALQEVPALPAPLPVMQQVLVSWKILLQKVLLQEPVAFKRPKILRIWANNISRDLQELEKQITNKISE